MKKLNESYLEIDNLLVRKKFVDASLNPTKVSYTELYEINSIDEINDIINTLKSEHKKARHIVYTYKFGSLEKNYVDKEPSGTTRGLIDIIHKKNLDNTLIVVIRYFGGILLGSGPLTRSYTKVVSELFIKQSTKKF